MTYLLDVNTLIALCDPAHEHHTLVFDWFTKSGRNNFATCAITENGFIRICSNPAYPNRPGPVKVLQGALKKLCEAKGFHYWQDSIAWRDIQLMRDLPSKFVTDIYLLALARRFKGKLVTLDRSIPADALADGAKSLLLLKES
jgi:uncharacterized protein